MKHLITIMLGLFAIINLNAQEPQLKFYLNDGTERTYRIADVEEMSFIKSDLFSYMSIYFTDSTKTNFDTKSIEKIEISEESELLSVYTCGYPYNYEISTIDSIIFGYDTDNLYETVTIGEQVWMQYNLDVCHYRNGDPIIHVQTYEEWLLAGTQGIGAWCYYDNDPENGRIYGKLYNWHAAIDPRGLAPDGWRVPSDDDWLELEIYLGMTLQEANKTDWRGSPVGAKLAGGYNLWHEGLLRNDIDFNNTGFWGTPGGARNRFRFYGIGEAGFWWTSDVAGSIQAFNRGLYFDLTSVQRDPVPMTDSFSVRLVKDK